MYLVQDCQAGQRRRAGLGQSARDATTERMLGGVVKYERCGFTSYSLIADKRYNVVVINTR